MSDEGTDVGLLAPGRAGSPAESATGDTAFLQAMLDAEAALTRAQAETGLAPAAAAAAVGAAARAERFDVRDIALRARSGGNPVIPLVADLTAAVPAEAAPYVHRGATSQDIMDTAMMLVARRTLDLILADLTRTEAALARLAAEHRDTVMPGRTLTQHAVPTTFGLKAAGWRSLTLDARDRVRSLRDTLPSQLGGAAGTLAAFGAYADSEGSAWDGAAGASAGASSGGSWGASSTGCSGGASPDHSSAVPAETSPPNSPSADASPADTHLATPADTPSTGASSTAARPPHTAPAHRSPDDTPPTESSLADQLVAVYARELRLAEPALPWHTLRTPVADLAGVLAFVAGALGKAAVDVLTLSRTEIAEVSEGAGGGSSAMPHKANPVRSTLVAAAARRAPALAATLHASMAAEDERPAGAWHAEWETLRDLLRTVGGASHHAAELAENLRVHPEAMREHLALTHGLIVSERLTAELTPLLGRARAKELLTSAARRTRDEGRTLADVLADEPGLAAVDLTELTDPARYTGSAGALTDRALERR
ncbi:lyase family protein [Streptomyces sp. NPDC051214]|uniref:class-II fumarase/aspartase family protein n=1 Tax=Streptomyces sp. NPDC051214 TaxID=3155282 RepID=UPI003431A01E